MMMRAAILLLSCTALASCSVLNAFGVLSVGPECGEDEFLAGADEGENLIEVCCEGSGDNIGDGDVLQCDGTSCVVTNEEFFEVECCGAGDTAGFEDDGDTICCRDYNDSTNYAQCDGDGCVYFEGGEVDCCADNEEAFQVLVRPIANPLDTYETTFCCRSTGPDLWRCGGQDCTGPDETNIECVE